MKPKIFLLALSDLIAGLIGSGFMIWVIYRLFRITIEELFKNPIKFIFWGFVTLSPFWLFVIYRLYFAV